MFPSLVLNPRWCCVTNITSQFHIGGYYDFQILPDFNPEKTLSARYTFHIVCFVFLMQIAMLCPSFTCQTCQFLLHEDV